MKDRSIERMLRLTTLLRSVEDENSSSWVSKIKKSIMLHPVFYSLEGSVDDPSF